MHYVTNESILTLILRIILGFIFLVQGYDKIFKVKMPEVIRTFKFELEKVKIPDFIIETSAYYSSFIELICGFTLIIGLFTNISLYLLGTDLILVVAAFSLIDPVWDMKIIFPRLILWIVLMAIPSSYNIISLDFFLLKE